MGKFPTQIFYISVLSQGLIEENMLKEFEKFRFIQKRNLFHLSFVPWDCENMSPHHRSLPTAHELMHDDKSGTPTTTGVIRGRATIFYGATWFRERCNES